MTDHYGRFFAGKMNGETAMSQAHATAEVYTRNALDDLCAILDIDRKKSNWREQGAPAAMKSVRAMCRYSWALGRLS